VRNELAKVAFFNLEDKPRHADKTRALELLGRDCGMWKEPDCFEICGLEIVINLDPEKPEVPAIECEPSGSEKIPV